MRLHHLEVTGFGPFAETTTIDFDALSDAGLFLLSGPTGAGAAPWRARAAGRRSG